MSDKDELMVRLTLMLDGCQELLDAAAERERIRELGKPMRQITMQQRAENARKLVSESAEALGMDLPT